jgi:hypothetical protein
MYAVDQRKNILIYNTHRSTQMYCCRSLDVSHQRRLIAFTKKQTHRKQMSISRPFHFLLL